MALSLAKTNESGVSVSYWKVMRTEINWHESRGLVEVCGYVDQAARDSGKEPVGDPMVYRWAGADFPFDDVTGAQTAAYTKLKTLPEWDGATDV